MARTSTLLTALLLAVTALAGAQDDKGLPKDAHESLDEAWWTGPMLAPSAATLPRGHILIEPYFFDITVQGHLDHRGTDQSTSHSNNLGSLTYALYGLTDKLTVGVIPTVAYGMGSGSPSSSGIQIGDITLSSQYGLTKFKPGRWIPTTAVVVQEGLPTGKYDRLQRANDGVGSGAYTTTVGLYAQMYFWAPNGRIVRTRFDVTDSLSSKVDVHDASVYGTEPGFRGTASPGNFLFADVSGEYSLTRRWVLAFDVVYNHRQNTHVSGRTIIPQPSLVQFDSGSSDLTGFAPAVEYSWKNSIGVLVGTRIIPFGRNTSYTIAPVVAINFVH